jgi:NFU1 iron-sulfur cluster scaffold homolog, mitochondrial
MTLAIEINHQRTPNPRAMKFIVDMEILSEGKVSIDDPDKTESPLAQRLLRLPNVSKIHIFENTLTVTQNGASAWEDLCPTIEGILAAELPGHSQAHLASAREPGPKGKKTHGNDELAKIDAILDREIRPALRADGGDLEIHELQGNILTVQFEGACGGCPSAMMGTLEAIRQTLKAEYDEKIEVCAI